MSKITVSLGSLVFGALVMFFFGSQISSIVQSASATMGIVNEAAIPKVAPLQSITFSGAHLTNVVQPLDGLDCRDCTFQNVTFEYSGGAFNLSHARISSPMRVIFKGAAANALQVLALVEALNSRVKPAPTVPENPKIEAATKKYTILADIVSPYGQKNSEIAFS
jgi:hypothetical protein